MTGSLLQNFDRLSFWLGFLTSLLIIWLIGRLRPILNRLYKNLVELSTSTRLERSQVDEIQFNNEMMKRAQGWHLASPLFSLDEIYIPTRLLAPAPLPFAYEPPPGEDITDLALAYTPESPEFAVHYNAPTLDLVEALQGGANLALISQPGFGKSTALAQLCCQIIRKSEGTARIPAIVPLLLHVGELEIPSGKIDDPSKVLIGALSGIITAIPPKRLPQIFHGLLERGKFLLLLDGLDELDPDSLNAVCQLLHNLITQHPDLQIVVAAHPTNLGRLPGLGFQIVGMCSWNTAQKSLFFNRWNDLWRKLRLEKAVQPDKDLDPMLLVGWLTQTSRQRSPLEITLKAWAAFAGDSLGPSSLEIFETYLRRMTANQAPRNRLGLEQLAGQMVLGMQPISSKKDVERWLGGIEPIIQETASIPSTNSLQSEPEISQEAGVRARGALPDLLECGLLISNSTNRVRIVHPVFTAYLASKWLCSKNAVRQLIDQPAWIGCTESLNYCAWLDPKAEWLESQIKNENEDPLQVGLIQTGKWLRNAPDNPYWSAALLRRLALCIQKKHIPFAIKARALYCLAQSRNSGVPLLLRQLLDDPQPPIRQLAALGLGYLKDQQAVTALVSLIDDPALGVSRASLLSLVSIGNQDGLEAVAFLLLNGEERLRKAAAEALSNDLEQGHLALQEGSQLEDAAVRRSVVFGLARIKLPWANETLLKLASEDTQWIVQDAANQALSAASKHPRTPIPIPAPAQTPWLIAFAGENGIGISPGKPAFTILRRALQEGNSDQRLAAIFYLGSTSDFERCSSPLSSFSL